MSTSVLGKRPANQDDGDEAKKSKREEDPLMRQVIARFLNPDTPAVRNHIVLRIFPQYQQICDGEYDHHYGTLVLFFTASSDRGPISATILETVSECSTRLTVDSPLKCVAIADWRDVEIGFDQPLLSYDDNIIRRSLELTASADDDDVGLWGVNDDGWTETWVCDRSGSLCPSVVPTTADLMHQVAELFLDLGVSDHVLVRICPQYKQFKMFHHPRGVVLALTANPDSKHKDDVRSVSVPLTSTSVLKCVGVTDFREGAAQPQDIIDNDLLRRCLRIILRAKNIRSEVVDGAGWCKISIPDTTGLVCVFPQ